MKINPNDPHTNMPIRLWLATEMAKGILAGCGRSYDMSLEARDTILLDAEAMADAMIEWANRDEDRS